MTFTAYWLAAVMCIAVTWVDGGTEFIWLPNAIMMVLFIRAPRREWLWLASGQIVANASVAWWHGAPPILIPCYVLANLVEVVLAALICQRIPRIATLPLDISQATQVLAAGLLIATPTGALLRSTAGMLLAHRAWPAAFLNGWLNDAVGVVIALIPGLLLNQAALERLRTPQQLRAVLLSTLGMLPLTYLLCRNVPFPFVYLSVPLALIALRFGALQAVATSMLTFASMGLLIWSGEAALPAYAISAGARGVAAAVAVTTLLPLLIGIIADQIHNRTNKAIADEYQLRSALDAAATGFLLTTADGTVLEANDNFCRMLGYRRDELLGTYHLELVHPADRERVTAARRDLIAGKMSHYELEKRYLRRDGSTVWAAGKGATLVTPDGVREIILQVDDITLRRAHEQAITDLTERLEIATRSFGLGVWDLNLETGELSWDDRMLALYEVDPADASRTYEMWRQRVHPDDLASAESLIEATRRGEHDFATEFRIVLPDGRTRHICASAIINRGRDGEAHMIGVNWDITARKEAELALATARDAAEAAARTKGEFLANMSHEIRTPMNAVLGMAHLLGVTPLQEEQRHYLNLINQSGRSLLAILNDVLDYSKIEAGRLELNIGDFNLDELLSTLASMMSVSVGEKDIELTIGLDNAVPRGLRGDSLRLQQVLINLAGNAIKFTQAGEVSVTVSVLDRANDIVTLRFGVRDTGIGIGQDELARLFSPFMQADGSVTRRFGGTGLGLVISRRLVEMMGGEIGVDSQLGIGSEFWMTLPFAVAEQQPDIAAMSAERRYEVLIVDDNATARHNMRQIFDSWGWRSEEATCGADALSHLEARRQTDRQFDIVLADWKMPEQDGLATLRAIRQAVPEHRIPVFIMVSAFGRESLLNQQAATDLDGVVTKPVTASNLFDTLQQLHSGKRERLVSRVHHGYTQAKPLRGSHILIVEDNPVNQLVARGVLHQLGATHELAENGEMAITLLEHHHARFNLVLMDVQMPVMDGFTATRLVRERLRLTLPIIAMTAGVLQSERDQCRASGMDDFIAKPIDVEHMVRVLSQYIHPVDDEPVVVQDAATSNTTTQPAEFQCFDPETVLQTVGNDPQVQYMVIEAFARDARDLLRSARQGLRKGEVKEATRALHTLKGTAGTLRAKQLAELAKQAERLALTDNIEEAQQQVEQLGIELAQVMQEIERWLTQHRPSTDMAATAAADAPSLDAAAIDELRALLRTQNIRALALVDTLKPALTSNLPPGVMTAMLDAAKSLRFKDMLALVDEYLADKTTH